MATDLGARAAASYHSRMKHARTFVLALLLVGCGSALPENIALKPEAEAVEFAMDTPSPDAYTMVGVVKSDTAAKEIDAAILSARNDLRNKAAAMGASLVIVDETTPDRDIAREKRVVHLKGRAFKVKE
jgi:hypothetical protein